MSAPLGRRGLALLLVTAAALAAGSVSPAAERPSVKRLSVFGLGQGIGHVRSRIVNRQLRFLSFPAGSWGGVYTVKSGAHVTIQSSGAYPVDPAVNQARADFVDSLVHGSEIATVKIYFAPPAEVETLCESQEVDGCYAPKTGDIVTVGEDTPWSTVEEVVAHEYGHHVATNRLNDPWPAVAFGTKRWATYEGVCQKEASGVAFPGDEGEHYFQNPGESFAESFMHLNEVKHGLPETPWGYDPMFTPDASALAAIEQDVLNPWKKATKVPCGPLYPPRPAEDLHLQDPPRRCVRRRAQRPARLDAHGQRAGIGQALLGRAQRRHSSAAGARSRPGSPRAAQVSSRRRPIPSPSEGLRTAQPKSGVSRSTPDMLTLQAILLTSSLIMVLAMVGSVMFLATLRDRIETEAIPVESADQPSRLGCVKQLWAPWRLEYIKSADEELGCVFCLAAEGDDEERLVVHRGGTQSRCSTSTRTPPATSWSHRFATSASTASSPTRKCSSCTGLLPPAWTRWPSWTRRRVTTSAGTSGAAPAPASSTMSTCTSCLAGAVTRTSCRCSRT